jgi:O-acetylhomoserine/O-acetylserine sulfhydrylase-like pyridoxal-dependent enzyme
MTLNLGDTASPDECWLALRGIRTIGVRLQHQVRPGAWCVLLCARPCMCTSAYLNEAASRWSLPPSVRLHAGDG